MNRISCYAIDNSQNEISNELSTSDEDVKLDTKHIHDEKLKMLKMLEDLVKFKKVNKKLISKSFEEVFGEKKIRKSLNDFDDFAQELEMEFCTECFLTQSNSEDCLYCHLKYTFKTAKRTKPSSKYWYTRAG